MLLYMRMARKAMVASKKKLAIACALDADKIRVRFIILMHEFTKALRCACPPIGYMRLLVFVSTRALPTALPATYMHFVNGAWGIIRALSPQPLFLDSEHEACSCDAGHTCTYSHNARSVCTSIRTYLR